MVVQCPLCLGRYRVGNENKVPLEGVGVKCPGCGNIFTIYRMVTDIQLIPLETLAPEPSEEPKPEFEPTPEPEPSVAAPEAEPSPAPEEEDAFQPKPPVFEPEPPPQFAETATEVAPEAEEAADEPPETVTAAPEEALAGTPEEALAAAAPEEALTAAPEEALATAPEISTAAPEDLAAVPPAVEAEVELPPDVQKEHNKAKRLARVLVKDIVLYHEDRVEEGLKQGNLIDTVGDEIKKSWQYYKGEIPEEIVNSTDYFKDALNQILAKGKRIFT